MVAAIERSVVTVQFCICPVYHAVYYKQVERICEILWGHWRKCITEARKCYYVPGLECTVLWRYCMRSNIVQKPLGNNNRLVRNRDNRQGLKGGGCDCVDGSTHSQASGLQSEQGDAG